MKNNNNGGYLSINKEEALAKNWNLIQRMDRPAKAKRRKNDFYPTPKWLTEKLLDNIQINGTILEACSGEHNITDVLNERGYEVITNDIDPDMKADYHFDASEGSWFNDIKTDVDWVITNPPFNRGLEILKRALVFGDNVAFLLRLSFLEPTNDRGAFLSEYPPNRILIMPRTSFTGDGNTDSVTCAWLIWDKSGINEVKIIPKELKS